MRAIAMFGWLFFMLLVCTIADTFPDCLTPDIPVVRHLEDMYEDDYGKAGLSHITIAGAAHHGMKEVEVWFETFAPGSMTPIHRHSCEEVFVALKGKGSLFMELESGNSHPGAPKEYEISPNTTFTIPVNRVHQVQNTQTGEDLQVLVIFSPPPLKPYVYKDWDTPHTSAVLKFPLPWDAMCVKNEKSNFKENYVFDEL